MNEAERAKARAILVRAATLEAQRQTAVQRGDLTARDAVERELAALWREFQSIESGRAA